MALQSWSTFYDEVLSELPKCSTAMADIAIKRAAIEFCERSTYYRAEETQDVLANTAVYTASPLSSVLAVPHEVLGVVYDGNDLGKPKSNTDLDQDVPGWRGETGNVVAYSQDAQDRVRLVRTPSGALAGGLILKIAYKPAWAATGIDDFVANHWREAICMGAKSRLMAMAGKPWTSPQLGMDYRQQFDMKAAQAKRIAGQSFGRRALRTKPV